MNELIFDIDRLYLNAYTCNQKISTIFKGFKTNIYYAVKANNSIEVISRLFDMGIGAEVLSLNELKKVPSNIPVVINGYYKDVHFLSEAILRENAVINIQNINQLKLLASILKNNTTSICRIGITIKNNENSRVGLSYEDVDDISEIVNSIPNIKLDTLHYHAGWNEAEDSKILDIIKRMNLYNEALERNNLNITCWNLGGSFKEPSSDPTQLYKRLKLIYDCMPDSINTVCIEPGRYLVGDCGVLKTNIIEKRKNEYLLNCATYGHLLSGATPKVVLKTSDNVYTNIQTTSKENANISLSGVWPSENDVIYLSKNYNFAVGDEVIFLNMGGYIHAYLKTLTLCENISYTYHSMLDKLSINIYEDIKYIIKYWDFTKRQFTTIPSKSRDKELFFNLISNLFRSNKKYSELEINRLLEPYYFDTNIIRRELVERGYLDKTIEGCIFYERK